MIETIDNNTKEKVFYYIAFGFVALQVIASFYLLVFEMFILFLTMVNGGLANPPYEKNINIQMR